MYIANGSIRCRRHIEYSCGSDGISAVIAVVIRSVFLYGRKIKQHLDIQSIQHIRKPEFLDACFIVNNADIFLIVFTVCPFFDIGIHSVDLADNRQLFAVRKQQLILRDLTVLINFQLVIRRHKSALRKLIDQPFYHHKYILFHRAELRHKAFCAVSLSANRFHILLYIMPYHLKQAIIVQ